MKIHSTILIRVMGIAIVISVLARPTPTWACSCIYPPQPAQAYNDATGVFVGKVAGISNPSQLPLIGQIVSTWSSWTGSYPPYEFYQQHITFEVHNSWKGVTVTSVSLQTGSGGGDCGYYFALGQQYVVYAYNFEGSGLTTDICTRTSEVSQATADLTYLQTLPPLPLLPVASSTWPVMAVVLLAVMLLVGISVWVTQRRGQVKTVKTDALG